jgi:hypothetical protein
MDYRECFGPSVLRLATIQGVRGFLQEEPTHGVRLTFFSARSALHDYYAGERGAFLASIAGIKHLRTLGIPVEVRVLCMRGNMHELSAMRELLLLCQVHVMRFSIALPFALPLPLEGRYAPFPLLLPYLEEAVEAPSLDVQLGMEDIPLCLVAPSVREGVQHSSEERVLLPGCHQCTLAKQCGGILRSYLEVYEEVAVMPVL